MPRADPIRAMSRAACLMLAALCIALPLKAEAAGIAKRIFTVPGFQQISLEGPYSVDVRVGSGVSVKAAGARDDLEALFVSVQGDRLVIRQMRSTWSARDGEGPVSLQISVPSLNAARVTGAGSMSIDRVKAATFSGALLGAGRLDVAGIAAETVTINAGGSGSVKLAGTSRDARLVVQGAGDIDAAGLAVRVLDAAMQGAGTITAQASDSARVQLAGSGNVSVDGKAKCTVTRTGAGQVRCGR